MTKATTVLTGHGLWYEGAPHDENGVRMYGRGTTGTGRGICRCGEKSPILHSAGQRQQWHREHKATIRSAATTAGATVKVGQVWADNDKRSVGRTITITTVGESRAEFFDGIHHRRALLTRFRPTSTGYRLVKDVLGTPQHEATLQD
ncbi:hypothetical protein [Cryobacterium zhongshanensis]|uniref:Uncharacterized protein n=1 Tax=Cryobacterium zhongshanensis TaxID=2928153 RepID=A0AA41QZH6_9MICO|nr:hypothetical protein [Cryobacterium zhongshanensis]MCI4659659.1 hypothetical protein [Cryobacterium zhongshanensis]